MPRQYTLKKRAEQQAMTRQRIVEAAVDLHSHVGPAATTVSMIAERAGVQRHTFYAHFPDERSLYVACSGLAFERDPLPDATSWQQVASGRSRVQLGLAALYAWYERNENLAACVLRDAEHHALTREIADLRFGPVMARIRDVLGEALARRERALLAVAMDFHCWRVLAREMRLAATDAAGLMADAIAGATTKNGRASAPSPAASRRPLPRAGEVKNSHAPRRRDLSRARER